jgi:hypothetical protein
MHDSAMRLRLAARGVLYPAGLNASPEISAGPNCSN